MSAKLIEAIVLDGMELPSRFSISPMCQYAAKDGHICSWHQQHVGSLALRGSGLLVMEATAVVPEGWITPACLGTGAKSMRQALPGCCARSAPTPRRSVLGSSSPMPAGRSTGTFQEGGDLVPSDAGGWKPVAPGPMSFDPCRPAPHKLDQPGIHHIRQTFVDGAKRACRAGFDIVELHAAHGYLLHSFCSPLGNERADAYGGSFANRIRLLLEIAAAVPLVWPKDRILGARITGSDWHEGGMTPEDAVRLAGELAEIGVDYVTVSSGGIRSDIRVPVEPGYQVPFASAVKRAVGNRLVVQAVGLIVTPEQAEEVLDDGHVDMVAIALAYLDDIHWDQRAADALGAKPAWHVRHERAGAGLWPSATLRQG